MPFTAVRILGILFDLLQAVTHLADSTFKILVIIEGFKRYSLGEDIAAFIIYGISALVTGNHFAKHILHEDAVPIAFFIVSLLGLALSPFYAVAHYLFYTCRPSAESRRHAESSEQDIPVSIGNSEVTVNATRDAPNTAHTLRENASRYTNFLIALDKAIAARAESYFLYKVSAAGSVCFQVFLIIATAIRDEQATTTQLFCIAFSLLNILMKAYPVCRSFTRAFFLTTDTLRIAFVIAAVFEVSAPNEIGLFGSSSVTVTYLVVAWVISHLFFAFIVSVVLTLGQESGPWALLLFPFNCIPSAFISVFVHEWISSLHSLTAVENSSGGYGLPLLNEFLWADGSSHLTATIDWKRTFENLLQAVKVSSTKNTASSMFRRVHESTVSSSSSSPNEGASSSSAAASSSTSSVTPSDTFMDRACHAFLFNNFVHFYKRLPVREIDDGETDEDEREKHRKEFEIRDKAAKRDIKEFVTEHEDFLKIVNNPGFKWKYSSFFNMIFYQRFYSAILIPRVPIQKGALLFALQIYLYLQKIFALLFPLVYAIRYFDSFTLTMQLLWYPWCCCCFMSVVILGPGYVKYYLTCQVYLNYIDRRTRRLHEENNGEYNVDGTHDESGGDGGGGGGGNDDDDDDDDNDDAAAAAAAAAAEEKRRMKVKREEERNCQEAIGRKDMIDLVNSYYCLHDTHTDISEHEELCRILLAESNLVVSRMFRVFEREADYINKKSPLRRISEKYDIKLSESLIRKLTDANVMESGEFKVIDNSRLDEIGIPREDRFKVLNLCNLHKNEESLLRPELQGLQQEIGELRKRSQLQASLFSAQQEKSALISSIHDATERRRWLKSANYSMNIAKATLEDLQQELEEVTEANADLVLQFSGDQSHCVKRPNDLRLVSDGASAFSGNTSCSHVDPTMDLKPSAEAEQSNADSASIATSNLVVANQDTRPTGANKIQDSVQGSSESSRKARSQKAPSSFGGYSVVNDDEFN